MKLNIKIRYIIVSLLLLAVAACSDKGLSPDFRFDSDVVILGNYLPESHEVEYFVVSSSSGERLSEKSYPGISSFKDGLAVATDGERFFYIDKKGDKVIDEAFKAATFFSEGRAWVLTEDNRLCAIDGKGEKLFYADNAVDVQLFYDGRSVTRTRDGFTEVFDKAGEMVLSTEGYGGYFVCSDMLPVSIDGISQGVMNMAGDFVLEPEYMSIGSFQWMDVNAYVSAIRPELFVVFDEDGGGVVSSGQEVIVPLVYTDVVLDGRHILASSNDSALWYDLSGNRVIDGDFEYAYPFGEGRLAAVCDDGLWGSVDRKGDWAIYPQWSFVATSFDANGVAIVYDNESSLAGMIDEKAELVLPAEYSYIVGIPGSDKYLLCRDDNFGIADSKGHVILQPGSYTLSNDDRDYQHYSIHID